MIANGVPVVDYHERPESPITAERIPTADPKPRFLETIGNLKASKNEGSRSKEKVAGRGFQTSTRGEEAGESEPWLRVGAPSEISHVAQLEQELGAELDESALDTFQIPEPRHVKYATVMAKNLRRDSQRAVNPKPHPSAGKTQMTPDERRELTRVQREVMWNLQKEGIVMVVRPGDDPIPYKRQGNPDVNTPLSVKQRQALRNKPLILEISNEYWCFPDLNPQGSDEMTKESYLKLHRKLHLALSPDTKDEDARNSAEVDWLRDTAKWGGRMTRQAFGSSMFELADIWTENIDEEEYTAFLWLLLETITNTNVVPPSFKPDREIECIVDKDLSEATNRIRDTLADSARPDRIPVSLDMDTVATVVAASRNARGNSLSPKLKDKHVQRLRALRQRLQALKQLRTWPAPGRTGDNDNKNSSGGGSGGGVVGVQDEMGVYEQSEKCKGNAPIEHNESDLVDERLAPREDPGDNTGGRATTTDGEEKHAEALVVNLLGFSGLSGGDGARVGGRITQVGNSADDQGGYSEADDGYTPGVITDRPEEDGREERLASNYNSGSSSSSNNNHKDNVGHNSSGDDITSNHRRKLELDLLGTPDIGGLHHKPGSSASSSSVALEDFTGQDVDNNARNKREEKDVHISNRGKSCENTGILESTGVAEDHRGIGKSTNHVSYDATPGNVRGELRGRNGPSTSDSKGANNQNTVKYARDASVVVEGVNLEQKVPVISGERRDEGQGNHVVGRSRDAVDGADARHVRGTTMPNLDKSAAVGGSFQGVPGEAEGVEQIPGNLATGYEGVVGDIFHEAGNPTDGIHGHKSEKKRKRARNTVAAIQKQLSGRCVGDCADSAEMTKFNDNSNSVHRNTIVAGHIMAEGVPGRRQIRLSSDGGEDALSYGEIPGRVLFGGDDDQKAAGSGRGECIPNSEYAPALGNIDSDIWVATENDLDRPHPSSEHDRHGQGDAVAAAEAHATNLTGDDVADGACGYEGGDSLHVHDKAMSRWMSRVPGGQPVDAGVFHVKLEEASLDCDMSSAVSSISGGQWGPSPTKDEGELNAGVIRDQGDGGGARDVDGNGLGRGGTASNSEGAGKRSAGLSSAASKSHASRHQAKSTVSSKGANGNATNHGDASALSRGPSGSKPLAPNFRPGGGCGSGWDGIVGTTDSEWERITQQAKAERKRRASTTRPVAKQSPPTRKKRQSAKAKARNGRTGFSKAVAAATTSLESLSTEGTAGLLAGDIKLRRDGGGDRQQESTPTFQPPSENERCAAPSFVGGPLKATLEASAAAAGEGVLGEKAVAPFSSPTPNETEHHQREEDSAPQGKGLEFGWPARRGKYHNAEECKIVSGGDVNGQDINGQGDFREYTTSKIIQGGGGVAGKLADVEIARIFVGPPGGTSASNVDGGLEDVLALLQPVLEKHNMSVVDVSDRSSAVLDHQGPFSLDAQDRSRKKKGVDGSHARSRFAQLAGTGSVIPHGNPSGGGLLTSGTAGPKIVDFTTANSPVNQSTVQQEVKRLESRERIPGARGGVAGHEPQGTLGHSRQVATGEGGHMGAKRMEQAFASQANEAGEFADGATRVGGAAISQNPRRKDEIVVESSSYRLTREIVNNNSVNGATSTHELDQREHMSLPTEEGKLMSWRGCTAGESTTDLQQDTVLGFPDFNTSFDAQTIAPNHGYPQSARPRTRSWSRAGKTGYESTEGGNDVGINEEAAVVGLSTGEEPRNETIANLDHHDEWHRSNMPETAGIGNSSSKDVYRMLDEPTDDRGVAKTNDAQSKNDAVGGTFGPLLTLEGASGAVSEINEDQNQGFSSRRSYEEPRELEDGNVLSATTAFGGANKYEHTALAAGSSEGDHTAVDRAKQGKRHKSPRSFVPNYLVSPDRNAMESDELHRGSGTVDAKGSSMLGEVTAVVQQHAREPTRNRPTADLWNVLGSIPVAGRQMSTDSEMGGRQQQVKARPTTTPGRKRFNATGTERPEILRRVSSCGVWRHEDFEHQLQRREEDAPPANASSNPLSVGNNMLVTVGVRAAAVTASRGGEPSKNSQQPHRHIRTHGTRTVVAATDQRAGTSGASFIKVPHVAPYREEMMVGEQDGFIHHAAVHGIDAADNDVASSSEATALGGTEVVGMRNNHAPGVETPPLKQLHSSAENVMFGDAFLNVAEPAAPTAMISTVRDPRKKGENTTVAQPQAAIYGRATAMAVDGGSLSTNLENVTCGGKPDEQSRPVGNDTVNVLPRLGGRSSSNNDNEGVAIVSCNEEAAEAAIARRVAIDRENLELAVARRISEVTGTQYDEALAEVRNATRSDNDKQQETRSVAAEDATPMTPWGQTPVSLRAQQARAGHTTNDETPPAARKEKAPLVSIQQRSRDNTEFLTSLLPSTHGRKQQSNRPGSDIDARAGAHEGMLLPSPRPRDGHACGNSVSHTHGNSNKPGLDRLRPRAVRVSHKSRRRPSTGESNEDRHKTVTNDGGEFGGKTNTNTAVSGGRAAAIGGRATGVPGILSGQKLFKAPRLTNDQCSRSSPRDQRDAFCADSRRQGQGIAGRAAAYNANKSGSQPGPAEDTTEGERKRGKRSSSDALLRYNVEKSAGRSTTAEIDDYAFRNTNRRRVGGKNGDGAEKDETTGSSHRTASGRSKDHERFARKDPGDRYYLPRPQRMLPKRTSSEGTGSTSSSSTPGQDDKIRDNRQQQPRDLNEGESHQQSQQQQQQQQQQQRRRTSRVSSSAEQRRTSHSSARDSGHQPDDYRPMLKAFYASGGPSIPDWKYGWRGQFTAAASTLSQDQESLPYYVDRKQVWHYVPDDGLPPWRDPGPGEPGWEPTLNYCEVKPDEEAVMEDRKRRDFLCERRRWSRGGDGGAWRSTTDAPSSPGSWRKSSTSPRSRSSSVSSHVNTSAGGNNQGVGEGGSGEHKEGDDGEEPVSSIELSIARRVNERRPFTTSAEPSAGSEQRKNIGNNDDATAFTTGSSGAFTTSSGGHHHAPDSVDGNSRTTKNQTASTAALTATKRPGTNGATGLASSSFRFLRPSPDNAHREVTASSTRSSYGSSVEASRLRLGSTTTITVDAAPTSTIGDEVRPGGDLSIVRRHPSHRRQHSSLSFAENPRATTAEMIRLYREQLRRRSMPSQQSQHAGEMTLTTTPPPLGNGGRQQSYRSTPWHSYVSRAVASGLSAVARPQTSIGGSKWSQDVRFQQHVLGRARLAPATRTAGGRWGANHGRLESLFSGEEAPAPRSFTYATRRESGPWILDANYSL